MAKLSVSGGKTKKVVGTKKKAIKKSTTKNVKKKLAEKETNKSKKTTKKLKGQDKKVSKKALSSVKKSSTLKKKKSSKAEKTNKTNKSFIKSTNVLGKRRHKYDDFYSETDGDDDDSDLDRPVEFNFKGKKEKDLVKELNKEDEIFIDDDDDDKDPEEPKDEDIIALEEYDEIEDTLTPQDDIFTDVKLDDNVRMYLKEIGQYQLLTLDREKRLAKEKQDAQNLLRKKGFHKKLKMDKEDAIKLPIDPARAIYLNEEEMKIVKRGELAQEVLIKCNLRLVVSIAKKYIGHGLQLLDLIQEGNLGLTRGIEKFDYKMGFKLSTYVTWWIRQAVSRALADQSKTIRIPVHMVETINRLNKEKKKLITELGYEPSTKQLAKAMKMSEEKVEEVIQIALDPISLDKPVGDEEDSIVADFIADQNVISPEANAERVMLKEKIQGLLLGLKDREKRVLELRFGINDDHPRTLEEVGKELKVTRERIRQIEDKALRKLKIRARSLQDIIK